MQAALVLLLEESVRSMESNIIRFLESIPMGRQTLIRPHHNHTALPHLVAINNQREHPVLSQATNESVRIHLVVIIRLSRGLIYPFLKKIKVAENI